MNYERMWKSLKKIVKEEYEMYGDDDANFSASGYSEGQYDEADYIAGEMKALEVREILLQEKEKCEAKNEGH